MRFIRRKERSADIGIYRQDTIKSFILYVCCCRRHVAAHQSADEMRASRHGLSGLSLDCFPNLAAVCEATKSMCFQSLFLQLTPAKVVGNARSRQ